MKQVLESPWLTVTLAIVVMTIGYVVYVNQDGGIASAGNYFCPAQSVCLSEECMDNGCSSDQKCKHCPGCNRAS